MLSPRGFSYSLILVITLLLSGTYSEADQKISQLTPGYLAIFNCPDEATFTSMASTDSTSDKATFTLSIQIHSLNSKNLPLLSKFETPGFAKLKIPNTKLYTLDLSKDLFTKIFGSTLKSNCQTYSWPSLAEFMNQVDKTKVQLFTVESAPFQITTGSISLSGNLFFTSGKNDKDETIKNLTQFYFSLKKSDKDELKYDWDIESMSTLDGKASVLISPKSGDKGFLENLYEIKAPKQDVSVGENTTTTTTETTEKDENDKPKDSEAEGKGSKWWIWVIILLVIVGIGFYFLRKEGEVDVGRRPSKYVNKWSSV